MCDCLYRIKNLLVSLLRNHSFRRIAATKLCAEKLLEHPCEGELATPAEFLGKRKRNRISIIYAGEHVCIFNILDMTAEYVRINVACEHCAFACAAAGHYEVNCLRIEKNGCEKSGFDISELACIVSCVHAVVEYFMS